MPTKSTMTVMRSWITGSVLACLVLLNTAALPQIVRHSLHHDQHTSATHKSSVCFWVCTAGQMEHTATVLPPQALHILEKISQFIVQQIFPISTLTLKVRGPPSSILS